MAIIFMNAQAFTRRVLDYDFTDLALLRESLETTGLIITESNQRLAMLGDAVLKQALLDDWYTSGAAKSVGSNLVTTLGSNTRLARAARQIGLANYMVLHPSHRGPVSPKTLATAIEALLGAIYLDSDKDMVTVKAVMSKLGLTPTG